MRSSGGTEEGRIVTIVVHHLERSRSHRVLWLLEELGRDYEIVRYERDPKTIRAPAALREIHPLGKSPVVTIDGVAYAESGAILEHLVETFGHGALRPEPGTDEARRYRFFMHYAEGSLMPPLLVAVITGRLRVAPLPFFVRPIARAIAGKIDAQFTEREIDLHSRFLESELAGRDYLAGDALTAADIQMSYPIAAAESRGGGFSARPRLAAYLERLRSRPAFQRAVERGGPVLL